MFALADSFTQLVIARFALGCIGAGFVVGIRMVSEWFPPKELGTAEGIYGGWGNFGSAAAAFTLPTLAILFGGEDGWRYAVGLTGLMSLLFSAGFTQLEVVARRCVFAKRKRSNRYLLRIGRVICL